MKQDQKLNYEDITFQVATTEGYPVMTTVTAEDQKQFVESGYGTVSDLIDLEMSSYRDWQSDC